LGETVMDWTDDYKKLAEMLMKISDRFRQVTGKTEYVLDLEYKKMSPGGAVVPDGGLVIKQVREIPTPDQAQTVTPLLINDPLEFEVYPGEFYIMEQADVFANHHLKSRWTLETRNMPLDANSLNEGLYTRLKIEYLDDDRIVTLASPLALLPSYAHAFHQQAVFDSWRLEGFANARSYTLRTPEVPTAVSIAENPILTLTDFGSYAANTPIRCLGVSVEYEHPILSINQNTHAESYRELTQSSDVSLWPVQAPSEDDVYEERSLSYKGVSVTTSFYFAPVPAGYESWLAITGATAPLKRWGQTTISGLTTEPIVLQGYYSQTYRPEHHNETEHFLFEPRLEPTLPDVLREQLRALDIRFIHVIVDHIWNENNPDQSRILTYGFDTR
jgi:hypothetical protein